MSRVNYCNYKNVAAVNSLLAQAWSALPQLITDEMCF